MNLSLIILSGGRASRLNGHDKGLYLYQGQPLITHALSAFSNSVTDIVISANRNLDQYAAFGYQVVDDGNDKFKGPLTGLHAALKHCQQEQVLVMSCDMPLLSDNLLQMFDFSSDVDIQIASVDGRMQLFFLMNKSLLPALSNYLEAGEKRVMRWVESHSHCILDCSADRHLFKNFNDIADF